MSDFNFKKPCLKCSSSTLNRCNICGKPLCNKCKSKKAINFPYTDNIIPKGICRGCKEELLINGALLSGVAFQNLLKNLIKKLE